MTIQPLQPGVVPSSVSGTAALPNDADKIEKSSRQFEAMLVRQVLADTFKPASVAKGPAAPGADIYQGFITDIVADHITQGGGLGISHLLQSQVQATAAKPATTFRPAV